MGSVPIKSHCAARDTEATATTRSSGVLARTRDTTVLAPNGNATLKLLRQSNHAGRALPIRRAVHLQQFCPPVVADGKAFVATYDYRCSCSVSDREAGPNSL